MMIISCVPSALTHTVSDLKLSCVSQAVRICVSQEGAGAQLPCLCFITHPCVAGRKVASFCAFLWVIVILRLNSFEFIQPSWMLSVYFYVCGEKGRRKKLCRSCRAYSGIYTEA